MKALVVYESMWGNTEKVARAVAQGLEDTCTVEVLDVSQQVPGTLAGVDLLVVGGPTHAFSMSRPSTREDAVSRGAPTGHEARGIREWLDSVPEAHVAVATFDTRVDKVRHLPGSAAKKAGKEVRRHRLGRLVDTRSFYVGDTAGPLLDGELDRARGWGRELVGSVVVTQLRG
jgi:hypothetical protein